MASELIVQTIQGPSSGANANKVLIPSGHTLDVSGGTLVPSAGAVVQVVTSTHGTFDATSTGYSAVISKSITPKYDNSLMIVRYNGHLYKYNTTAFPNSEAQLSHDSGGGAWTQFNKHPYITYHEADNYMYSLSMAGRFWVTSTNTYTVNMNIDPKGDRTYIYSGSNLLTIEEIKQ